MFENERPRKDAKGNRIEYWCADCIKKHITRRDAITKAELFAFVGGGKCDKCHKNSLTLYNVSLVLALMA